MAQKKQITVTKLLSVLPGRELDAIAEKTKVNHYCKVLDGKSVFYLIIYALIECQRNSLRTMEDIFNSPQFKFLFNLDKSKTVRHSSISERLSAIDVGFFRQAYELTYKRFSELYSSEEQLRQKLIRVDSTMVAEAASRLKEGMYVGKNADKNFVKYTFAFDGIFPSCSNAYTDKKYLSEDCSIPEVVFKQAEVTPDKIFVFDRGVQKREVFTSLSNNSTSFVGRIKADARYKVLRNISQPGGKAGVLTLISDQEVRLGKPRSKKYLDETYRIIIAENEAEEQKYYFVTNMIEEPVDAVLSYYKKRWDIEVFFRFLKQELNFNRITSTSANGLSVMLYMTMTASMLVLIYKRLNNIGYKTAVRRVSLELNEFIIKLIVQHCGGDPSLVFR